MTGNPLSHWSTETFLTELLDLHRSGWDGIGYMMAGEKPPERLFLVVGAAFAQRSALRAGLELHKREGRAPFIRYCLTHNPNAPKVKQELCRRSQNGSTVIAALVFSLDIPNFFEQITAGKDGDYLRHRAELGCLQVLGKVKSLVLSEDDDGFLEAEGLHGTFGQGGTH
jgi:hypothetical protein